MALTIKQKEQIIALLKVGELSNRAIAKEVGCSESVVRTIVKDRDVARGKITQLVDDEISYTIKQEEISAEKNALNPLEKRMYDKLYHDKTAVLNMFNNATIENQEIANNIQGQIAKEIEDAPEIGFQHLPNLMAVNKITESNRKQLFGQTEAYKAKEDDVKEDGGHTYITYEEDKGDG